MTEVKQKSLHVLMDPDEFAILERARGPLTWKDWLFGFQKELREANERANLWKTQAGVHEGKVTELEERVRNLQEQIGDV